MDQAEELRNVIKKQNQRTKKPARIITVTSGKGGVGKSNIAVNLAVQFQRMGLKTIIFDADIGLANVEVMFGTIPKYSLNDLIYHDKEIEDIITDGPEGVGFISGGSGIMGLSNLTLDQISYLVKSVEKLSTIADVVIVDTGAVCCVQSGDFTCDYTGTKFTYRCIFVIENALSQSEIR